MMYSIGLVREAEWVLLLVDSHFFDGSHPPNRKAAHTHASTLTSRLSYCVEPWYEYS